MEKTMESNNYQENIHQNNAEFAEAMDFIHSLCRFGINLGLDRIRSLLERLDNPERNLKIVHIGGTNGKGSTSALLAAILRAAGYRAGMFISPHLEDYRERITINGQMINCADLVAILNEIKPHLQAMVASGTEHPTEFEVSTVMAILYFARQKPDIVLMEVGLGGEIDSTNVVNSLITVITSIGLDHMDLLGSTIGEIAKVKAGIIKKDVPVVTSVDKPDALSVIEEKAREKHSVLVRVGQEVSWSPCGRQSFDYLGLGWKIDGLRLAMLGRHQFINASAALAVCEVLQDSYGFVFAEEAIRSGLQSAQWPCRLEVYSVQPKIILDGAHNVDGMAVLQEALESELKETVLARRRLIICLGMLDDKERKEAVKIILPLADQVIVTKPDSPRAVKWMELAGEAADLIGADKVKTVEDPVQAVQAGISMTGPEDMLLVTGSLYMLGEVRGFLNRNKNI